MDKAILAAVRPGETQKGNETVRMLEVQYNPDTLSMGEDGSLHFDLIIDAADGTDVQAAVKGFLGMLSSPVSRKVIFYWGSMNFPGEVTQMNASYDSFSSDGTPLRGKVTMTLRQTGSFGAHVSYWEKAYDAFPPNRK